MVFLYDFENIMPSLASIEDDFTSKRETDSIGASHAENFNHPNMTYDDPYGPPLDFTIPNYVAIGICVIGIISNGLLLFVICKDPLKNLRRSSWITITNLAMADFIVSVTSIPFCHNSEEVFQGDITANLWALCVLYIGYFASFLLLLLFGIERYIAVTYPMASTTLLSKHRSRIACVICWLIATVMACFSWMYRGLYSTKLRIGILAILEIAVVLMIIVKFLLIKVICMKQPMMVVSDQRREQKRNMVITLLILILILIVTALPYFVAMQIQYLSFLNPGMFPGILSNYFPSYYFPLARLNFIANPFVYAWRLHDYRNAFLAIFGRRKKGGTVQSYEKPKQTLTEVQETRC